MPTPRHLVLTGVGFVGVATMATSSVSLYKLGVSMGIGDYLAAALPVALDVGAGVAALAWLTETGAARAWGRVTALCALIGSLIGNGLQHALTLGLIKPELWLVLAVGASIPAMLFAVIHLAALMARPDHQPATSVATSSPLDADLERLEEAPRETWRPRLVADLVTDLETPLDTHVQPPRPALDTSTSTPVQASTSTPGHTDLDVQDDVEVELENRVRDIVSQGGGRRRLMRELDVSEYQAKKLLEAVRPAVNGARR